MFLLIGRYYHPISCGLEAGVGIDWNVFGFLLRELTAYKKSAAGALESAFQRYNEECFGPVSPPDNNNELIGHIDSSKGETLVKSDEMVSIIVCVYNSRKTIGFSLRSLLQQVCNYYYYFFWRDGGGTGRLFSFLFFRMLRHVVVVFFLFNESNKEHSNIMVQSYAEKEF